MPTPQAWACELAEYFPVTHMPPACELSGAAERLSELPASLTAAPPGALLEGPKGRWPGHGHRGPQEAPGSTQAYSFAHYRSAEDRAYGPLRGPGAEGPFSRLLSGFIGFLAAFRLLLATPRGRRFLDKKPRGDSAHEG
ncbi:hypothetical protein Pla108_38550 [Botrimarina colliarenosi]|uniref:Uncharacterized protein n=1 Tax=Botrimarina colliarenosi TaxID=2528001 RepID=A0A5C6A2A1_9BACT|nr:hypothetical protein Pla108_38550 [Botrimarina colliarenosi]